MCYGDAAGAGRALAQTIATVLRAWIRAVTMSWYYEVNREQRGPVSEEEFAALVRAGVVRAESLVWREGWPDWKTWGSVAAEFTLRPPSALPSPPPPLVPPAAGSGFTSANATGAEAGRPLPITFSGDGGEYFRIWIVNVLLTIVTFGIYAAWAKVRTRRYFYANTSLAGHAFEYLADPKRILIGNLIVGGAFLLFNLFGAISPLLQLPLMLAIAAAVPWFIAKSLLFNARNSAWRGLRFGFRGDYGGALVMYVLLPLLVPLTLGLIWPFIVKSRREWMVTNHRFGTSSFHFGGQAGDVYVIYLKAALFFLPLLVGYGVLMVTMIGAGFAAARGGGPEGGAAVAATGAMAVAPFLIFGGFICAFVGASFVRARMFVYAWGNTTIAGHRFSATMRARDLIGLQLVNMLLTVFTLGLAWPWVAVRTARFQLSALQVVPAGSLDAFVGDSQPEPGAVSEAAGDFLDFDIGFGV